MSDIGKTSVWLGTVEPTFINIELVLGDENETHYATLALRYDGTVFIHRINKTYLANNDHWEFI